MKVALTIAGSDSGAGAGIQSDLLTFASLGVWGTTAIVVATAQNPKCVFSIEPLSEKFLKDQIDSVSSYFKPNAVKCGMLFSEHHINCVSDFFEEERGMPLIVDPVMISTSATRLLKKSAISVLKKRLLPLAKLITPNLDEAAYLLGIKKISKRDMMNVTLDLSEKFSTSVLLKGGHLGGNMITDSLYIIDKNKFFEFSVDKIKDVNTHGSGCTLSAAICGYIAKGFDLEVACRKAHKYLISTLKNPSIVRGKKFINHFPKL